MAREVSPLSSSLSSTSGHVRSAGRPGVTRPLTLQLGKQTYYVYASQRLIINKRLIKLIRGQNLSEIMSNSLLYCTCYKLSPNPSRKDIDPKRNKEQSRVESDRFSIIKLYSQRNQIPVHVHITYIEIYIYVDTP